jgi:EpsD family peptidyl-prolyl cis-trans isomerase
MERRVKSKTLMVAALIAATATLGGCDQIKKLAGGGGKPSGQVVATVNGDEITALELRQEMGNFSSRDPQAVKLAQQRALENIVLRKLVVQKAKDQKLDKSADYSVQLARGEQNLLAQLYQRKVASAVAVPTRVAAESYIASHPEKFSDRHVLVVDQLVVGANKIPPERLKPIKTFEELKALLDSEQVAYQPNVTTIDTLTANEQLLSQINKLPPGEIFVIPQGGGYIFNNVVDSRAAPFEGDTAVAVAINVLRGQRGREAFKTQVELMRKAADKSIVYNDAYKPDPALAKKVKASARALPAAPATGAAPPSTEPAAAAPTTEAPSAAAPETK